MSISYNGYDANCITMLRGNTKDALFGSVAFDSNGRVTKAANGAEIFAVAVANREQYVTVQTRGYVELKYTGAAPTYGRCKMSCDGNGGVVASSTATPHTVLKVDTVSKTVGFII